MNASQLLASFLGSENEKIGHAIAQSDFAGELNKLIPAPANSALISSDAGLLTVVKHGNASTQDPKLQASSAATHAAPATKPSRPSATCGRKSPVGPGTKINSINAKIKNEANLFITNPAIADAILADLQYPAETRKACNGIQNQEGSISMKDLKSLLDTKPASGPTDRAQVPAEHARALVESISTKEQGTGRQGFASGGTLQSSIQIKSEGSYSAGEFRELLEKVLQAAETAREQSIGSGSLSGSAEPAKTVEGLQTGQIENLMATVPPSFISDGFAKNDFGKENFENGSSKKIFASEVNNPTPEAQSANVRDVREHSVDSVSDNLKPDERLTAAGFSTENRDREVAALGMEAGIKGGSGQAGSTTGSAAASLPVRQETAQMPIEGLDRILNNLNATVVSSGTQQPEAKSDAAPTPGGPHDGSVAQAQNMAPLVKGVEQQADRPRGELSSLRLPHDAAGEPEATVIKKVAAEHSSSERSFDSDPSLPNASQETQARAPASTTIQEKDPVGLRQSLQGVNLDGKTEKSVPAAALSDSIEGFDLRPDFSTVVKPADSVPKDEDRAIAGRADPEEITARQETSQGVEIAGKAASTVASRDQADAGGKIAGQQELTAGPWRFGFPMEDFHSQASGSVFGEGANPSPSLQERSSATSGMDGLKVAETQTAISGQNTTILSKQIEKQLGSNDSSPESAVFQSPVSSFQTVSEINPAPMNNSATIGFTHYDPYLSAELAQNMSEHLTGVGARQLVLEMEPDELGKISIKVGAKKDEISVVALTQNEQARQTLMSHAPALCRDLKDQGLVLDKFMVDVNGEKSGAGNYPEGNKARGKTTPSSKTARTGSIQTVDRGVYVRKTDGRSQISIFA